MPNIDIGCGNAAFTSRAPATDWLRLEVKKIFIKQIFIILSSCVLFGCAGAPDEVPEAFHADESRGSDCIIEGTVRDYRVLDDANLVVTGSGRRKYHVTLNRRAFGMRSSWQIGFVSRGGQICPGFSDIVVDDSFGPARIGIRSIRRLTPEEHEDLLVRFGKNLGEKAPKVEQTPAPESVEGAEVEELD